MTYTCVFCDIVAGRMSASIVHQDQSTIVLVDLRQPTAGHLLVIPKLHVEMIYDLPSDTAASLMRMVVLTAQAMREALQPAGLSMWQSNGLAAGQEVPHVHIHLLTRASDDGLLRIYPAKPPRPERKVLDQLALLIKAAFIHNVNSQATDGG